MQFQTIMYNQNDITSHVDDEGDFQPTNFDEAIMEFQETLHEDGQVMMQIQIIDTQNKKIANITFRTATPAELTQIEAMQKGQESKILNLSGIKPVS